MTRSIGVRIAAPQGPACRRGTRKTQPPRKRQGAGSSPAVGANHSSAARWPCGRLLTGRVRVRPPPLEPLSSPTLRGEGAGPQPRTGGFDSHGDVVTRVPSAKGKPPRPQRGNAGSIPAGTATYAPLVQRRTTADLQPAKGGSTPPWGNRMSGRGAAGARSVGDGEGAGATPAGPTIPACSSAHAEHPARDREAAGANPATRTMSSPSRR